MKPAVSWLSCAASIVLAEHVQVPLQPSSRVPLSIDKIPLLGFGTWNLKTNCSEAVSYAIQIGYRHIDCAAAYGNEAEVGVGIADGLAKTGLAREDLWITSKLWNDRHDKDEVEAALDMSLAKLQLDYLDLYHMHWPVADSLFGEKSISYRDTWGAMTIVQAKGKARYLGISNFSPAQLSDLLNHTDVKPAVHQMELHPYLQQREWVAHHQKHGIHVTAYSPLAGTNPVYGAGDPVNLLNNTVVQRVAHKRGCTLAQVALAWGAARGTSVIPKSSHFDRIHENFLSAECRLKAKDIEKIDALGSVRHRYNNPSLGWGLDLYEGLEDSRGQHRKHS